MDFQITARKIEELADECVNWLARICSIPALGPENQGDGEMEKYLVVKDSILALNPSSIDEVHAPDDRVPGGLRPNLLAVFSGRDTSRTLWILSHIDVVPPGELSLWSHDPFSPRLKDGILTGRGVEDNGQATASSLFAIKAVLKTGGPAINVGLAVVSDEETGNRFGLEYVLNQRPDTFKANDLIVVPDAGNSDGDHMGVAEKHLLHVRFRIKGVQCHASRPDLGRNTMRAAAYFIVELDRALHERFPETNPFFNPPISTFEPTRKDANVPNINTVPGEDVFYFDCRVLPEIELSRVMDEIRAVGSEIANRFEVDVSVEEAIKNESPNPTSPDAPVVVALAQAVQEVLGVQARPVGIGGNTVAGCFRRRGLPAVVWEKIHQTAHAPNEKVSVENLVADAKVFARMMM